MVDTEKNNELEQAQLDFISTVSHELRTPLTSIRGFADTLLTSYDRLSPEQRDKFLHIIKDQSNRLIHLVENLLTVSKMQSDKELIIYKSVNIVPFVDSAMQMVKNQYKTHKYITNYQKNLPNILVDTDKFQQIMINLIDNASKYSEEGSTVTITVGQNYNENSLFISVKDEGIGISEEDIKKIFNKFSRVDSPLTRKIQGNGLGLYITKTLVEKMNGKISASSKCKGSEFIVEFKAASIEDNAKQKIKE
ncbi:HAMP domain-containing histidine kinase [bacterium]|nr:HAMP domain-containing histidine kinase [bacterium]